MADFTGKKLISESILSDIAEAIRYRYGVTNTIKPIDMAELIYGISGEAMKRWYVWYMSNIAPIDGMYNSHSYSNVYIVGNELVVLYRSAPHHFSDVSLCKMRICRINLTTFEYTNEDLLDGLYYWGSVYCDGVYYIFDELMYRYDTTDFETFNKVAYTVPTGASEPYYITVGENNRFISPHSNSSKKGCMMYTDDYGLTWLQATGDDVYNATLTTHGATTKVGDTLVAYCQATKTDTPTDNDTVLNVLTSTDNGLTWSGAEVTDEDLKYCGPSFASGMFAQIGDEWFLCLSSRLQTTDEEGYIHLGNVRLFKGTAEDVINGTMSLHAVVDDFNTECTSISVASNVSMTDTGNIGMVTDGESIYIVYAKPIMHQSTLQSAWITSNSMLCMAVVNSKKIDISKADSYYDINWESQRDTFVSAQDITHNLYIYGNGDTIISNVNGIDIYSRSNFSKLQSDYFCPSSDITIPFDEYIDIRIVGKLGNRYVNNAYAEHYYGCNIDEKKYAITGTVNWCSFNKTHNANYAASLGGYFGDLMDYHLTYKDGVVTVKWNGVEIENVKSYVVPTTTLNATEKTAFLTFEALATLISNNSDFGKQGFMAITIDTDGDISDLLGEIVIDPELPVYTVTNNLTNCTTTQNATEINEGSTYSATITADTGYRLSEVSCTMGGIEQTITDGEINIESVTGDIVIIAVAEVDNGIELTDLTFDGTLESVIDTGVKLYGDDTFTLYAEYVPTSTGKYYVFGAINSDSSSETYSIRAGRNNAFNDNGVNIKMGQYGMNIAIRNYSSPRKILVTHDGSTKEAIGYVKTADDSVITSTCTSNFFESTNQNSSGITNLCVGGMTANETEISEASYIFEGTVNKFKYVPRILTEDEINELMA